MDKTTCTLVAVVLCLAVTASAYLVRDNGFIGERGATSIEDVPWQVSLLNSDGKHFCGGAILSESFIVTSAYCLLGKSKSDIKVHSGSNNKNKGGVKSYVSNIIPHEEFGAILGETYDIALIELRDPLKFGGSTKAISLAEQDDVLLEGELIQFTGWDKDDTLLEILIPVLNINQCRLIHNENNIFCAENLGVYQSACRGNSGGPAVLDGVLVGIVSGNQENLCDTTVPVMEIAAVRDWIDTHAF